MLSSGKTLRITKRLYSGRDDGWADDDFHRLCDGKERTVSLFQVADGDCIGAYISLHWGGSGCKADSAAFLFNLTHSRYFPSIGSRDNIACFSWVGPYFYTGSVELLANSPFNGDNMCFSYTNKPGFKIPLKGNINQLTNKKDGHFTISELEVWLVETE